MTTVPLISIITINYNNADGLQHTIDSVLQQLDKNFEYLVIDGGSTDGSVEIIKRHKQHINYWVSEQDSGIYDAMNKGISKATGRYLMFLNSGDCLSANNIMQICDESIRKFTGIDIFYGHVVFIKENGRNPWRHPAELDISFLKKENINHQASLIKAGLFKEFGAYPEKYKLAGDHWMYLISFANDKKFKNIDHVLVDYDGKGMSHKNRERYDAEMKEMWHELIPAYTRQLVDKYQLVEYAGNYKFLKHVVPLHRIYTYKKKLIAFVLLLIIALIGAMVLFA